MPVRTAWYYEVLERSSARWHDGKHDAWPAMNFLIFILTQACKEFEQRVGQVKSPRGERRPWFWRRLIVRRARSAFQTCEMNVRVWAWIWFARC